MTTKLKKIALGGIGFTLAYLGYVHLQKFNGGYAVEILDAMGYILRYVIRYNDILSIIWLIGIGALSFCKLFGIDGPVLYGCWCVIRAFFKMIKDIFCWLFLKKANPFT